MASPAPISSMLARATSPATSKLHTRARPSDAEEVRPPAFKASLTSAPAACRAGISPKTSAAPVEISRAKTSARASTPMAGRTISVPASAIGSVLGRTALRRSTPQTAKHTPSAPPARLSSRLSLRICAIRRPRRAPNAARIPISLLRPVTRASNRLATFTHASSSSSPTAPRSNSNAGRMYSKSACFIPTTDTSQPASLGVCRSMRRATALNSDCAPAIVTPGFRRAMTPKSCDTRSLARSSATGHGT